MGQPRYDINCHYNKCHLQEFFAASGGEVLLSKPSRKECLLLCVANLIFVGGCKMSSTHLTLCLFVFICNSCIRQTCLSMLDGVCICVFVCVCLLIKLSSYECLSKISAFGWTKLLKEQGTVMAIPSTMLTSSLCSIGFASCYFFESALSLSLMEKHPSWRGRLWYVCDFVVSSTIYFMPYTV